MTSEAQRLASKAANFKGAVETHKTLLQRDNQCRAKRYEKLSETSAEKPTEDFVERERQCLLAQSKRWSTDDFETVRVIGQGSFGTVRLVKRRGTEEFYAIKQMSKASFTLKNARERIFAERNILAEARSKWFVTLHFAFQDSNHIFMVMEFLQGGDFIFHLEKKGRLTFEHTQFYMGELLEALDTVHQHGFVHRDVKPDNIVLTAEGHLKLLDFGLCKHTIREELAPETKAKATISLDDDEEPSGISQRRRLLKSNVGTPQYMAPEVWSCSYGCEADIWSLGVLTFECLVGHVPFHAGTRQGGEMIKIVRDKIQRHAEIIPRLLARAKEAGHLTITTASFIQKILIRSDQRLNARQCRQDPFFFGLNFTRLHSMTPPINPVSEIQDAGDTRFFDEFRDDEIDSTRELPPDTTGYSVSKKDASLEWCGYEFNLSGELARSS